MEVVQASDLADCDLVVHFATHSIAPPFDTLLNCLHWNLMVPLQLFEQARLAGISRYLVAGSCFEYGLSGERYPFIPVDAPLEPTNSYAASKAAASIALQQWAREYRQALTLLRVFQVYGDGEAAGRLWPSLKRAAKAGEDFPMTAGEQVRDFINVVDVARAFLDEAEALMAQPSGVKVSNLGSGYPQTVRQFSEYWWGMMEATGCLLVGKLPYRNGEVMRYSPRI